ncbi:hypothetical protein KAX02_13625 [candidate division WOR-3 bacterium]|nr:hypothetical protein [candidate division WOR-3 bacterium]
MKEDLKHQIGKQLKYTSAAIDLIKISQRTQHTSIKEALRKMLRSVSMLAGVEIEDITKDRVRAVNKDLMKKAKEIRENRERRERENAEQSS